jgi:hypothetical protein
MTSDFNLRLLMSFKIQKKVVALEALFVGILL